MSSHTRLFEGNEETAKIKTLRVSKTFSNIRLNDYSGQK